MSLRVAITGATGFLGAALARGATAQGAELLVLGRRPLNDKLPFVHYDLATGAPPLSALVGCSVVVHCAYDLSTDAGAHARNVAAALALRDAAHKAGARFMFISSMSAHAEALSAYGRSKWEIEQSIGAGEDAVIKPGIIVGAGGLYSRIRASLVRMPIVPLFYGGNQPIQPIAVDDLVSATWRLIRERRVGTWALGTPDPITLRDLYRRILRALGRRAHFLPVPGEFALRSLRFAERCRIRLPVTSDNLLGLKCLRAFDVQTAIRDLGIELLPLDRFPWT